MEAKEEAVPESEARGGFRPTPIKPATSLEVIADEYIDMFLRMEVVPDRHRAIDIQRRKVVSGSASYKAVAAATAVPWAFIGIVHALEAGFDFSRHLHNGDPLNARTVQVPQGRPTSGQPPFAWEVSAEDALRGQGLDKVGTWTLPRFLYELERYNGFGYRFRSLPTPDLWSGSNQYERGKFVRDGVFDREAVSTQIGGAVLLRALGDAEDLAALPAI
jgi:lysozyme family protein